jgi:hypothetical protein
MIRDQQVLIISQLSNSVSPKKWNLAGLSCTFRTNSRFALGCTVVWAWQTPQDLHRPAHISMIGFNSCTVESHLFPIVLIAFPMRFIRSEKNPLYLRKRPELILPWARLQISRRRQLIVVLAILGGARRWSLGNLGRCFSIMAMVMIELLDLQMVHDDI